MYCLNNLKVYQYWNIYNFRVNYNVNKKKENVKGL